MTKPEKMSLTSMDISAEKREQLKKLLPEVFTEDKIDFKQLQRVLGEWVEPGQERFGLNWHGKAKCMQIIQQPSVATLKPVRDESVNFDESKNLFIEGDNLEVLKLLQKSYFGKVKMIYIDPPYNTGKEFVYPDNYAETLETYLAYTGQMDENHRKFSTNTETEGRYHSNWLKMMYPRLYLARNLLREDGVIFISINDNEQANLKALCDLVFGEENHITTLHVEMSTTQGMKVAAALKGEIVKNAEYIAVYSKNKDELKFSDILYSGKDWDEHYSIYFDKKTREKCSLIKKIRQEGLYPKIKGREIAEYYKNNSDFRSYLHEMADKIYQDAMCDISIELSSHEQQRLDDGEFIDYKSGSKNYLLKKTKTGVVRQLLSLKLAIGLTDDFERTYGLRKIRGDWWPDYYKDMMNINKEGGIIFKNGKKPIRLLKDIAKISTESNDIVLDFFAGSCTTAHAVMQLNAEDGGNRKFICVQLPEPTDEKSEAYKEGHKTIADIGKERIRRAAKKMVEEQKDQLDLNDNNKLDLGFKVFKLDRSNFKIWEGDVEKITNLEQQLIEHIDHIHATSTPEDILYELLLKAGFPLATPVEKLTMAGKAVFSIENKTMLICLDEELNQAVIDAMAEAEPTQVICLDKSFHGNDQLKVNAVQTFKARARETATEIVFKTV